MRRLMSLATLNAVLLAILSLMFLAVLPGCEPSGVDRKSSPVPEKKADIEIEHRDGKTKIDIDRKDDGGLKINIEKKGGARDDAEKKDEALKDEGAEKTPQPEPRRRTEPLRISSLA